jgi:hypothetical protein
MRWENFDEKFSAALCFLSDVIAFLLWSDHDHDLVTQFGTHGFECECLLLPIDVELDDPSCNINHGSSDTQEWTPKNKWSLTTDIHFEYHEVHGYERIPDSHWDIFRNSYWTLDRLTRQLQMHGTWK